jgi:uncharacterized protein YchJ
MIKNKKTLYPQFKYKGIKIIISSEKSLFVELDNTIYYIDNSTNEKIIQKFKKQ